MKRKLFNVLLFASGAAIGSLVTWKIVKSKYERVAQEEIDKFVQDWPLYAKDRAGRATSEDDESLEEDEDDDVEFDQRDMSEYGRLLANYRGTHDNRENRGEGEGDGVPYINGPYIIPPEDFADGNYDHTLECLTYYSDGVLANDWNERLDIEETIGEDAVNHFGDYADEVIHVRNERTLTDYEIVRDPRTFAEVSADDPLNYEYETGRPY